MLAILRVENLSKRYGNRIAVRALSFEAGAHEIVGLLGPNGAGKTTTINMVLGVLSPSGGRVVIQGIDVGHQRAKALAQTNFSATYAPLPGNLTVYQNLRVFGMIYAVPRLRARIDELLAQLDLTGFRNTKVGLLSSGEQARVGLAKALLNRPRLLLLDEPTASLDPSAAEAVRRSIRQLVRDESIAALWTSHNMYEVEAVCDRVLFLSKGEVLLSGDPRALPATHGHETLEALFIALAREPLRSAGVE